MFKSNKNKYTLTPTDRELLPFLDQQSLCHLVQLKWYACVLVNLAIS